MFSLLLPYKFRLNIFAYLRCLTFLLTSIYVSGIYIFVCRHTQTHTYKTIESYLWKFYCNYKSFPMLFSYHFPFPFPPTASHSTTVLMVSLPEHSIPWYLEFHSKFLQTHHLPLILSFHSFRSFPLLICAISIPVTVDSVRFSFRFSATDSVFQLTLSTSLFSLVFVSFSFCFVSQLVCLFVCQFVGSFRF